MGIQGMNLAVQGMKTFGFKTRENMDQQVQA